MHKYIKIIIVCAVVLTVKDFTYAASLPKPFFNVTAVETKELTVEQIYSFNVMRYDPPVKVTLLSNPNNASYATPEQTLVAHFSAMFLKDYSVFLGTWSREDQKAMEEKDQSLKRTSAFWIQTWDKVLANRSVEFIARIESGSYVLIEYRLFSTTEQTQAFSDTVVLKNENDRWVLTNELAADPVPVYWKTSDKKVKKMGR